ncbi:MAG: alpha-galactosidase [Gammaproteobacteria bacterium]|nr:alpha-galactosidase [Gammaproteobacteria bacterium]
MTAINSSPTIQTWRLDIPSGDHTLVFVSVDQSLPEVMYSGRALSLEEDLDALARCSVRPITPGTMDQLAPLSILPEQGQGFLGRTGLEVYDDMGRAVLTQFKLRKTQCSPTRIEFVAEDDTYGLAVGLTFNVPDKATVLSTETTLSNQSSQRYRVNWLSTPVFSAPQRMTDLIEYEGRWTHEFTPIRKPITRGIHLRENLRGRTGFDHFAAMIVAEPQATFCQGTVTAVHFVDSDLHRMFIEEIPDGRRQIQSGFPEEQWVDPDQSVSSGRNVWAFSTIGLNGLSHAFQDYVRHHVITYPFPDKPRPIHYNCWEAVYFDHDVEVLKRLAKQASQVGAERFVLDDGWFGTAEFSRNDDTTSLGDWYVDEKKYPDGLAPLIDHIHSLSMTFGLWIEPEMINQDSTLAKEHPEWILAHGNAHHRTGRQQLVLDLTIREVTEYLFERIDSLLSNHAVDYVKWDMNRDITRPIDSDGFPVLIRQSKALRSLLARVRSAHPTVELESCASGGGRIDYGVLQHVQRFWLSDSHDAHERWKIQNQAFLFLPPETYGSHVGAALCHTSARQLSMAFRAGVATSGSMGIEADLSELSQTDFDTLSRYTRLYKQHRQWMHRSKQYRLDTHGNEALSNVFVAEDQSQFLLYAGTLDVPNNETTAPIYLLGLEPQAHYRVQLVNPEDINPWATRIFDSPLFDKNGVTLSGASLMQVGLILPFAMPDSLFLVYGQRV